MSRYAFGARSGELRWSHRSHTPLVRILGSSRLSHVIVQAEIETFAIEPDGEVAWRIAHTDVVTEANLVGGRLVLTSFAGQLSALDPQTGRRPASQAGPRPASPQARAGRWTSGGQPSTGRSIGG